MSTLMSYGENRGMKNMEKKMMLHQELVGFWSVISGDKTFPRFESCKPLCVSIFGMAGIGKTTVAREVFEHPSIKYRFDAHLWVSVGQNGTWQVVVRRLLAQVAPKMLTESMTLARRRELEDYLIKKEKRCLIVLDDLWDDQICSELSYHLKEGRKRSFILVTTRLTSVTDISSHLSKRIVLMDGEKSWALLREKVFGEERCPPDLEKAGKKIAEECEGLPLLIVQVAKLLSKAEKTPEYWNNVAEKKNSVFVDAHDQILDVIRPSYTFLPAHYKPSFVYMGVFPHKYEIPCSKLINLLSVEGFHRHGVLCGTSKDSVEDCMKSHLDGNMIMTDLSLYGKKSCRLHSVFWHLCNRIARENNFYHVLSRRPDSFIEGIKSHRRLCIHNNILFSIKDVYDSMASAVTARSLLCIGPYHQYPVPVCLDLRLLRVLYGLSIRFYEFPMEVVKLVLLRYLAITYDGEIPPSISKLWNLESLTVHRHLSIKSSGYPLYLPMEIWDMKELEHLEIMGHDLKDPSGAILPNLLTLLDVSARNCTKSVFEGLPKVKKLRIRIELAPDAEPLSCFDHIPLLDSLESLKCVIVNPYLRPLYSSIAKFSSGLQRLKLSGFGYPWEDMRVIASLPNLKVLKLRCYAFQGPEWDTRDNTGSDHGFMKLEYLLIEDTDLAQWRISHASFPSLQRLSIKNCYKLEQIPLQFVYSMALKVIELVDCSPSAVSCAKQVEEARKKQVNRKFRVLLHSSLDDGNIKSGLAS